MSAGDGTRVCQSAGDGTRVCESVWECLGLYERA